MGALWAILYAKDISSVYSTKPSFAQIGAFRLFYQRSKLSPPLLIGHNDLPVRPISGPGVSAANALPNHEVIVTVQCRAEFGRLEFDSPSGPTSQNWGCVKQTSPYRIMIDDEDMLQISSKPLLNLRDKFGDKLAAKRVVEIKGEFSVFWQNRKGIAVDHPHDRAAWKTGRDPGNIGLRDPHHFRRKINTHDLFERKFGSDDDDAAFATANINQRTGFNVA